MADFGSASKYVWHIWKRLRQSWFKMMTDMDDLVCSFEVGGVSVDMSSTLLLAWILFGVLLVAVAAFVYNRHFRKASPAVAVAAPASEEADGAAAAAAGGEYDVAGDLAGVGRMSAGFTGGGGGGGSRGGGGIGVGAGRGAFPAARAGKPIATPIVNGPDKDAVDWTNRILFWAFNDVAVARVALDAWMKKLNQLTEPSTAEHGVQVSIDRIHQDTVAPILNNATVEVSPKDDVVLMFNAIIPKLTFIIHTSRQKGDKVMATDYQATVNSYAGKLKITTSAHNPQVFIAFVDHPNLHITLKPIGGHQSAEGIDEQALQDVIDEILTNALSNWSLDLQLSQFPNCPAFRRADVEAQPVKPIHYDSMMSAMLPPIPLRSKQSKRLLVKVIKAHGLGASKGCKEPYCVVEMDEPSQKHQTNFLKDTTNPFWDEHFLFNLNFESSEVLFELYDRSNGSCLGLGIVAVDDLLKNPSQRQIIPLQPTPYEKDDVSGSITVEFLFMDAMDIPILGDQSPSRLQHSPNAKARTETNRLVTPGGTIVTTTTTTMTKPSNGTDVAVVSNGGDPVTDTALRELEHRQMAQSPPSTTTNKSTLIIHSVQRDVNRPTVKPPEVIVVDGEQFIGGENPVGQSSMDGTASTISSKEDQGRSRAKDRRSFMNTLRKRFSFRAKRSRSMDQKGENDGYASGEDSISRSASADRARGTIADVPGVGPRIEVGSARSSLSETSGISESSTQTYLSEMSTLVIETVENGISKHYLLPASMAHKSKWRKRGTKLHIYNDHIFVAKHFPGSTACQVCTRHMPRRIGKQGYECRDCQIKCHKQCHVKTDVPCPYSTVNLLELEYVQDPSASVLQSRTPRKAKSS